MPSNDLCRVAVVAATFIAWAGLTAVTLAKDETPPGKSRLFEDFDDEPSKKPTTRPETRSATVPTTAPATAPATQEARVVDLLTLINPNMDYSAGTWRLNDDGDLESGGDGVFWIEAPYRAPEEYDFIVEFTRKTGETGIAQLLAARDKKFAWVLCGDTGTRSCISKINGKSWGNPTDRDTTGKVVTGQRHRSVVRVRKGSLSVSLDDQKILHFPTRYRSFTPSSFFPGQGAGLLGVGVTMASVVFHRIEVVEVNGRGQILERTETPHPKSEPAATQPVLVTTDPPADGRGLRAEFFQDRKKFTRPIKVRYDPELDFDWVDAIPDPDVPYDRFAVRWTGFLRPPVAGVYRFTSYSDDWLALWIDDKPILSGSGKQGASLELDNRAHTIRVDFRDDLQYAHASLHWRPPGEKVDYVVPAEALFFDQAAAESAKVGRNAPRLVLPKGTGLQMEAFTNSRFMGTPIRRFDRQINWYGGESAIGPGLPADHFSVRWTSWLKAPKPGTYRLHATAGGKLQMRLDGKLLFDIPEKSSGDYLAVVEFTDQPMHLVAEYSDSAGIAGINLRWEQVDGFKQQLIPPEAFFTNKTTAAPTTRPAESGKRSETPGNQVRPKMNVRHD